MSDSCGGSKPPLPNFGKTVMRGQDFYSREINDLLIFQYLSCPLTAEKQSKISVARDSP